MVDIPDLDTTTFQCETDADCADDYVCVNGADDTKVCVGPMLRLSSVLWSETFERRRNSVCTALIVAVSRRPSTTVVTLPTQRSLEAEAVIACNTGFVL